MFDLPKNLDTILHIGAGQCQELPAYLESSAKRIILVEPNPNLADFLRQRTKDENRVQVLEVAITDDPKLNHLTEYNLPEATSLYQPTGLKELFPGLRSTTTHIVTVKTPQALLEELSLADQRSLLVIQAPGAEKSIVHGLSGHSLMDCFSDLMVTANPQPFYKSNSYAEPVLAELKEQGYDIRGNDDQDAEWPQWHLTANPLGKKLKKLGEEKQILIDELQKSKNELDKANALAEKRENELEASCKKIEEENKKLTERANNLDEKTKKSEKRAEELAGRVEELKKRRDTLQKQLGDEQQAHKATQKELETLKKELESSLSQLEHYQDFNRLKEHMDYLFGQQSLQLEQAANALGQHVTRTTRSTSRELEAGLYLQRQLGEDLPSLEEGGERLPSVVALELSKQLKARPYDLIIEFGGGVTTSFMGQTLRKRVARSNKSSDSTDVAEYIDPSDDDLPKRILCFEHNRTSYDSLARSITESGLSPVINLHYSPLVPYTVQGQEYLFYDCSNRLQQVANVFENRSARIFILLNPSDRESRVDVGAALSQVLQYLSSHTLDLFLRSPNHAEMIQTWCSLLEQRGLDYQCDQKGTGQQASLLTVNP